MLVSGYRAAEYSSKLRALALSEHVDYKKREMGELESRLLTTAVLRFCLDTFGLLFFSVGMSSFVLLWKAKISYMTITFSHAWQSDNGGLFFGKACGKLKLAPRISPKKTVEGLVGAYVLSIATGMLEQVLS